MRTQEQLPSRPSDLIELAVHDFRQLDRSRYTPNHIHYHMPIPGTSLTAVCLAGAIIARTLQQPAATTTTPAILYQQGRITIGDARKLIALDHARSGLWSTMLFTLGLTPAGTPHGAEAPEELHGITQNQRDEDNGSTGRFHDWPALEAHLDWLQARARMLQQRYL